MMDKHAAHEYMSAGAEALGEMHLSPQIKVATLRLMEKQAGINPFKILKDAYRAVRAPKGVAFTPPGAAAPINSLSRTGAALEAAKSAPLAATAATGTVLGLPTGGYLAYDKLVLEPEEEERALALARRRQEEESRQSRNMMLGLGALGLTAGAGAALYNKYKSKGK